MYSDIWKHAYSCQACAKAKRTKQHQAGYTQAIAPTAPGQELHMDTWGPATQGPREPKGPRG